MIICKVTTETERVLIKLINEIIEKGFLYLEHIEKICFGLTDEEKRLVLKNFSSQPFVKLKENIYRYADVVYDDIIEEEILKSVIKPEFVNVTKKLCSNRELLLHGAVR